MALASRVHPRCEPMNETQAYEHILTTKEKARLRGQAFKDRELVGVDLSGADLRDALFERVVLRECTLAGADLRGTQFVLCDFHGVRLLVDVDGLSESDRVDVESAGGCFQPTYTSRR